MDKKMCGCGCKMRSGGMCMKCGGTAKMSFGGSVRKMYADGGDVEPLTKTADDMATSGNPTKDVQKDLDRLRNLPSSDDEVTALRGELVKKYQNTDSPMENIVTSVIDTHLNRKPDKGFVFNNGVGDADQKAAMLSNKEQLAKHPIWAGAINYIDGKTDKLDSKYMASLVVPMEATAYGSNTKVTPSGGAGPGPVKGGNMGRLSAEQVKLNKLIAADGGTALAEDDVLGDKTRKAMKMYEAKGKYKTPALFSEANVAKYAENMKKDKAVAPKKEQPVADNVIDNINTPTSGSKSLFGQAGEMFAKEIATTRDRKQVATADAKSYDVEKGEYVYDDKKANPVATPKVTNEENLKKAGLVKVPTEGVSVLDGDTIEWNGKRIRIGGIEGNPKGTAFFDAAERGQPNMVGDDEFADGGDQLRKAISSIDSMYVNPNGPTDEYGRIISPVYYGSPDGMFHAADSLGSVKGNAVFGDGNKYPKSGRQTMIEGKNEYKYSDNYDKSPSAYRKEQEAKKGKTPLANVPKTTTSKDVPKMPDKNSNMFGINDKVKKYNEEVEFNLIDKEASNHEAKRITRDLFNKTIGIKKK